MSYLDKAMNKYKSHMLNQFGLKAHDVYRVIDSIIEQAKKRAS
jgi:hypothetical protein